MNDAARKTGPLATALAQRGVELAKTKEKMVSAKVALGGLGISVNVLNSTLGP